VAKKSEVAIQAIETEYKGVLFRSRLEARWAMFLDMIGLSWEYEPGWYQFDTDVAWGQGPPTRYAPDFLVSGLVCEPHRLFLEVKREGLSLDEGYEAMCKAVALAEQTKEVVVIGFGYPGGSMEAFQKRGFDGLPTFISDDCYFVEGVDGNTHLVRSGHYCRFDRGELIDNAVSTARAHRFWNPKNGGGKDA
jgi:hypothetical protein